MSKISKSAEKARRYRERLKNQTLETLLERERINSNYLIEPMTPEGTLRSINRAQLFLKLWYSGTPYDVCVSKVDEIYPLI